MDDSTIGVAFNIAIYTLKMKNGYMNRKNYVLCHSCLYFSQ